MQRFEDMARDGTVRLEITSENSREMRKKVLISPFLSLNSPYPYKKGPYASACNKIFSLKFREKTQKQLKYHQVEWEGVWSKPKEDREDLRDIP